MIISRDNNLKKKFTKLNKKKDKPWFNKIIEKEIKKRREINRKRRNAISNYDKLLFTKLYNEQKIVVQRKIMDTKESYERDMTLMIKKNKDNKKTQWKYMNKLRGKEEKDDELQIYGPEGDILSNKEEEEKYINDTWKEIYHKHENNIEECWNETRESYMREDKNKLTIHYNTGLKVDKITGIIHTEMKQINVPNELAEHYSAAFRIERKPINTMKEFKFSEDEVNKQIKRLKNNKAPGPDSIKNELYKAAVDNKICLKILTEAINNENNKKEKPKSWSNSKTVMIPKEKKPNARQLRPVALTDASYKLFMNLYKGKIEEHLENNCLLNELQIGFTKRRRIEDNMIILHECKENAFKTKTQLIVIAVDYQKAYDSINRIKIVEVLKYYKVESKIIDTIVEIYKKDKTEMIIRKDLKCNFEIKSGIRQGCTLSATLFKMVTYKIMEEIERSCKGIMVRELKINSIFYADDGIIMTNTKEEAMKDIKKLKEISRNFGLEINTDKSNIIIYNKKEEFDRIEGIEVKEQIKYLGVDITNKRNMFKNHIEKRIKKAKKLENATFAMIESSCNRGLVGKTYWKNICVPAILYGFNTAKITEKEINSLQVIENGVYRKILKAPSYAPTGTLRGEIGSAMMKTRIIKGKLLYWKSVQEGNNELLKELVNHEKCFLNLEIDKWLNLIGLNKRQVLENSKEYLQEKIRRFDLEIWLKDNDKKKSLEIYNENRKEIVERTYYNSSKSLLMFRYRTNTLNLNDRKRHKNEDTKCDLCGEENEDLEHFLLECTALNKERNEIIEIQRPRIENKNDLLSQILFGNDINIESGLQKIWLKRLSLLEQKEINTT